MTLIPQIYLPPPSPFDFKEVYGNEINWDDCCSEGLILCWPFNENQGKFVYEAVRRDGVYDLHFGPETSFGTGANVPEWVQFEGTTGLKLYKRDSQQLQMVGTAGPPIDIQRAMTIECWFRALTTSDPSENQGIFEIGNQFEANSGKMFWCWVAPGAPGPPNHPYINSGFFQTNNVVFTPITSPYVDNLDIPNHLVFTWNGGNEHCIYGNGVLLASSNVAAPPFFPSGERFNYVKQISTNLQIGGINAIFYKISVYNCCLGPEAVKLLAANPMRIFRNMELPGQWTASSVPDPGGGGDPGPDPIPTPSGCTDVI